MPSHPTWCFSTCRCRASTASACCASARAGAMPLVVFVTAFDEFAVRAFEAHALDYLVKPLSQARFDATIAAGSGATHGLVDAGELAARLAALLADDAGRRQGAPLPDRGGAGARPAHRGPDRHRTAAPRSRGNRLDRGARLLRRDSCRRTTTPGSRVAGAAGDSGSTPPRSSECTGRRWCGSTGCASCAPGGKGDGVVDPGRTAPRSR